MRDDLNRIRAKIIVKEPPHQSAQRNQGQQKDDDLGDAEFHLGIV